MCFLEAAATTLVWGFASLESLIHHRRALQCTQNHFVVLAVVCFGHSCFINKEGGCVEMSAGLLVCFLNWLHFTASVKCLLFLETKIDKRLPRNFSVLLLSHLPVEVLIEDS